MTSIDDITRWSTLPEGQFFERKSAFDRSGAQRKRRKATDISLPMHQACRRLIHRRLRLLHRKVRV